MRDRRPGSSRCIRLVSLIALATALAIPGALAQRYPGPKIGPKVTFTQKDAAEQAQRAADAVERCDRVGGRRQLELLERTAQALEAAASTPVGRPTMRDDAYGLLKLRDAYKILLELCGRETVPTPEAGIGFGFFEEDAADTAASAIRRAGRAAKDCRRDLYRAAIADLRGDAKAWREAAAKTSPLQGGTQLRRDADNLERLATYLEQTMEARFKHCPPEGARVEAPPADAPPKAPVDPRPPKPATPGPGAAPTGPTPPGPGAPITPPAGPQRPAGLPQGPNFTIEPWVSVSVRFNDASGAYAVNDPAIAAPGSGKGDKRQGNFCGGVEFNAPLFDLADVLAFKGIKSFALGTTEAGFRFGVCDLGSGEKVVFSEIKHGADGLVTLTEKERVEIMVLFMLQQHFYINLGDIFEFGPGQQSASRGRQYAAADLAQAPGMDARNWWPFAIYFGVGPSFVRTEIAMTSNQVPGGGVFEAASQSKWDTGVSFVFGGKTALCRNCAFGNPVMFGIEGQWTHLPSRDIAVRSSTFGFVESGRVFSRSASKVSFRITVPFGIGR